MQAGDGQLVAGAQQLDLDALAQAAHAAQHGGQLGLRERRALSIASSASASPSILLASIPVAEAQPELSSLITTVLKSESVC